MKHAKKTLVCFHLFFLNLRKRLDYAGFPWNTYVPHKDKEERLITYGELHHTYNTYVVTVYDIICINMPYVYTNTSSAARGGAGSFKKVMYINI